MGYNELVATLPDPIPAGIVWGREQKEHSVKFPEKKKTVGLYCWTFIFHASG